MIVIDGLKEIDGVAFTIILFTAWRTRSTVDLSERDNKETLVVKEKERYDVEI